jgi:molybdate transport system ATP-binding protein
MRTPKSSQPFLSLLDATFRLGERLVFENTSWRFQRHEHWAILGPNGSGKSLLADALRGQLPLVHGDLRYHFRAPAGGSPEEAIGHVSFEDRKFEVHETVVQSRWNSLEEDGALRVRDFLAYERVMDINPFEVTTKHERARAQFARRRQRALALLQIAPLLERALLSLSNGERQRVQLARAFCLPLRLLILDEPFTGLDAAARLYFHRVLERLMETPLRVLLIATRMEDLPRHITHLLCVENCRVTAAGPRGQILLPASERARPRARQTSKAGGGAAACNARTLGWGAAPEDGRTPAAELVQLRDVSVRYGEATILRGINWTVRAGESWALLGPNGSGKTTLLSLLLGDHPQAYRNHVVVFGQRRGSGQSIWELKRRIGWVSPELHLHFNEAATCFEVVASGFHDSIGLFEPPTSRQRSATRQWLAQFRLLEFARQPLYALSLAQQRMVLLARALVKRPRLLILDEPCQGLDAAHRELFIQTVDELLQRGAVTAIYVTHRQDEIPGSIHRVLRLAGGRARVDLVTSPRAPSLRAPTGRRALAAPAPSPVPQHPLASRRKS